MSEAHFHFFTPGYGLYIIKYSCIDPGAFRSLRNIAARMLI